MAEGLGLIKSFEGFSPTIYICPAGWPTIGYGHVVQDHEEFEHGIDEGIGEELLRLDVEVAERAVLRLIHVPLADGQFDALTSFTFVVHLQSGRWRASAIDAQAKGQPRRSTYGRQRSFAGGYGPEGES